MMTLFRLLLLSIILQILRPSPDINSLHQTIIQLQHQLSQQQQLTQQLQQQQQQQLSQSSLPSQNNNSDLVNDELNKLKIHYKNIYFKQKRYDSHIKYFDRYINENKVPLHFSVVIFQDLFCLAIDRLSKHITN